MGTPLCHQLHIILVIGADAIIENRPSQRLQCSGGYLERCCTEQELEEWYTQTFESWYPSAHIRRSWRGVKAKVSEW